MIKFSFTILTFIIVNICYAQQFSESDLDKLIAIDAIIDSGDNLNWNNAEQANANNLTGITWDSNNPKRVQKINIQKSSNTTETDKVSGELDLTGLSKLTDLNCEYNKITSLILSSNTLLVSIICRHNEIISITLPNTSNITSLICNNNKLTTIDLSQSTLLTILNCDNNNIESLNITSNTNLSSLYCSENNITPTINTTSNVNLKTLYVKKNKITSLDLTSNTNLEFLICSYNLITALNISNNTNLEEIYCPYNKLTDLQFTNSHSSLRVISCSYNKIPFANLLSTNNIINNLTSISITPQTIGVTDTIGVDLGDNVTISIPSPSNTNSEYKWFKNNNELNWETTNSLQFNSISEGDKAIYYSEMKSTNNLFNSAIFNSVIQIIKSSKVTLIKKSHNAPAIQNTSLSKTIEETTVINTLMTTITATDADNNDIGYYITSGNTNNDFKIDVVSGELKINKTLNYLGTSQYNLTIVAKDYLHSASVNYEINIINPNQFTPTAPDLNISLSETAANGSLAGKVIGADADPNPITYSIVSGNTNNHFSINSSNGEISINTGSLEFDDIPQYILFVKVADYLFSHTAKVTISIINPNAFKPLAIDDIILIKEIFNTNTIIDTVKATDADNNPLTYVITEGNDKNHFNINSLNGELKVNTENLDYNKIPEYNLKIKVYDYLFADTANIKIKLMGLNKQAPVAPDRFVYLINNSLLNSTVDTVIASDPDNNILTYTILSGNEQNHLAINSSFGIITVNTDTVNETKVPLYILKVKVSDYKLSDTSTVTIKLAEKNNHKPRLLSLSKTIGDDTKINKVIGKIKTLDADNNKLTIIKTSEDNLNHFIIDSLTGDVIVNTNKLNFDSIATYSYQVKVSDYKFFDTGTLDITLINKNLSAPTINNYSTEIPDSSSLGKKIITVTGTDSDKNEIKYKIIGGDNLNHFLVDSTTGDIKINSTKLNFDSIPKYEVIVSAYDYKYSNSSTVTISIINFNKFVPQSEDLSLTLKENTKQDSTLATIKASDKDGNPLSYEIIESPKSNHFKIDLTSGAFSLNTTDLKYDSIPQYKLKIKVWDYKYADTSNVTIDIINGNKYSPKGENIEATIKQDIGQNTVIDTIRGTDQDNNPIKYKIINNLDNNHFAIDTITGILKVNTTQLDYEKISTYNLQIKISDYKFSDTITATVTLINPNQNSPTTEDINITIVENIKQNTLIGTIKGTDIDNNPLSYKIINTDNIDHFIVNSENGQITVNTDKINFDSIVHYTYIIKVSDYKFTDSAILKIEVTNANDFAPESENLDITIDDNIINYELIGTVVATDKDLNILTYEIISNNYYNNFVIDSLTGVIKTKENSFVPKGNHSLTIKVSDFSFSDTCSVTINYTYEEYDFFKFNQTSNTNFEITYRLDSDASVSLNLYNLQGQIVMPLSNGTKPPGIYKSDIPTENTPHGYYIIYLIIDTKREAKIFLVH